MTSLLPRMTRSTFCITLRNWMPTRWMRSFCPCGTAAGLSCCGTFISPLRTNHLPDPTQPPLDAPGVRESVHLGPLLEAHRIDAPHARELANDLELAVVHLAVGPRHL